MTRTPVACKSGSPKPAPTVVGRWCLQDAKARFRELVRSTRSSGPQTLTPHDQGRGGGGRCTNVQARAGRGHGSAVDRCIAAIAASRHRDRAGAPAHAHARARTRARYFFVSGRLLDTNVISELRRPWPNARVVAFVAAQPLQTLFISTVTLAEIRFGIESLDNAGLRSVLIDWLTHKVKPFFIQRVLPVSEDVMLKWRLLVEEGCKTGHTFCLPDLIVGATGLCHGLTSQKRKCRCTTRG